VAGARRRLAALTAALSKRRATLEALLAGGVGLPAGERLHAVRVALRRTVSLARLTRDVPAKDSGEALRQAARDLRRALGARRIHEVAVAILRARFRRDGRRRAAAERLATRLERDSGETASPGQLDALLASLRREFAARDAALSRLASPLAAEGAGGRLERRLEKQVRRRLGKRARRLLSRGIPGEGSLHAARIDARDLRYGLEFAGLTGSSRLLPLLERFQETAGRAHDRAELIALVRRTAGGLPAARRREALRLLPPLLADAERALLAAQASARALLSALELAVRRW
jgi:CHAD domain-containing protein